MRELTNRRPGEPRSTSTRLARQAEERRERHPEGLSELHERPDREVRACLDALDVLLAHPHHLGELLLGEALLSTQLRDAPPDGADGRVGRILAAGHRRARSTDARAIATNSSVGVA